MSERHLRREPAELAREPRELPRLALPAPCAETLALLARAARSHAARGQYAAHPVLPSAFGALG